MEKLSDGQIRLWIVEKLLDHEVLCRHHISIEDLPKGKDRLYRKQIKKVAKKMVANGWLVRHKADRKRVCLNKHLIKEFKDLILRSMVVDRV